MSSTGKVIGVVVLMIVAVLGITWIVQGNNFFMYKVFAPQYASVQRKVFENTAPYNMGMMQDLRRMQEEYITADAQHKAAIGAMILHNYAQYDEDRMPPDLRTFYEQVKRNQGIASPTP